MNKKGISLVALVITIIVLIILTGAVILNISGENSVILKAKEATLKSDVSTVIEAWSIKKLNLQLETATNGTVFNPNSYNGSLSSFGITGYDENKYEIQNGKVVYKSAGFTAEEQAILATLTSQITQKTEQQNVLVEGIEIDESVGLTFTSGQSKQFSVTVTPNNATNQAVTWTVSNSDYTVDQNGNVTAPMGVAECILTATAQDGSGISDSVDINMESSYVVPIPIP